MTTDRDPPAQAASPHAAPHPADVLVRGLLRGRELAERRRVAVDDGAVTLDELDGGERTLLVAIAQIDGMRAVDGELTLYLASGDVLELSDSAALPELGRALDAIALDLGEVTRALRGVGSRRARPGSDHDRFFGPLLRARLSAAGATTPEARVAAIDARELRLAMAESVGALAADRHPEELADRRALQAELGELLDDMTAALEHLHHAATRFRAAPAEARYAAWRGWVEALRVTYLEADRAWLASLPALADPRGAPGRFWRRVLRLGRRSPGR